MKVLHTADFHVRDADYEEVKKCLEFMVDRAVDEKPDLIVIAGDIYDNQNIKQDSRSAKLVFEIVSRLAGIAPIAIVIGTPSHDGTAAEVLAYVKAAHPVHIASLPEQIALKDGVFVMAVSPDAILSFVPTPTKQFFRTDAGISGSDAEIASAMSAIFADFGAEAESFNCPHILVGHFAVGGARVSETQQLIGRDIEISHDQIRLANADLVCLGHIHMPQRIGDGNVFYSGSIYRGNWGELEPKGFYVHELQPFGEKYSLLSRFIETPTRKLVKFEIDLSKSDDWDGEFICAAKALPDGDLSNTFVRLEIKVFQDESGKIDKKAIMEWFLSYGTKDVDIRLIRIPRVNVRSQKILKLESLRDKLTERAHIVDEAVPDGVLAKADLLESYNPDQIIQQVATA